MNSVIYRITLCIGTEVHNQTKEFWGRLNSETGERLVVACLTDPEAEYKEKHGL
jgi:hypothetical protein